MPAMATTGQMSTTPITSSSSNSHEVVRGIHSSNKLNMAKALLSLTLESTAENMAKEAISTLFLLLMEASITANF